MGEDIDAVAGQLRRLHELSKDPNIHIVISHDPERLAAQTTQGILGSEFERH